MMCMEAFEQLDHLFVPAKEKQAFIAIKWPQAYIWVVGGSHVRKLLTI